MRADMYGRSFRSLRISLTSKCNFACTYCVSGDEKQLKDKKETLTVDEICFLTDMIRQEAEIREIRLTGGEPLLFSELPLLIQKLTTMNLPVEMTSNVYLLKNKIRALKEAGLTSINISLDAVEDRAFYSLTMRNCLKDVIAGIDAALEEGVEVKLNAVIMRNKNEDQILPLLEFASRRKIVIRYLELMEMGHLNGYPNASMVCEEEILREIGSRYSILALERTASSTARYFVTSSLNTFGLITNTSQPFCLDCDRLRLDSYGNIYGCLSSGVGISIKDLEEGEMEEKLNLALSQKKTAFSGSHLSMKYIGG